MRCQNQRDDRTDRPNEDERGEKSSLSFFKTKEKTKSSPERRDSESELELELELESELESEPNQNYVRSIVSENTHRPRLVILLCLVLPVQYSAVQCTATAHMSSGRPIHGLACIDHSHR